MPKSLTSFWLSILSCGSFGQYSRSKYGNSRQRHAVPTLRGNLVRIFDTAIEDDYYLMRDHELGKGGCGVVLLGASHDDGSQYAIKMVNKAKAERARLERELRLMKDVDHTNIVRLFSVYDSPTHMYFVMELCSGGHLGNLLSRQPGKFIDEDWARRLCRQIVSAVAHIHSRGIAHRDIKLQNILIDCNIDRHAQVKLIDFGYGSRYVGALPMRTKCGTPYTTAPEVIREHYDERCDVWSIGVVLYIMLSGRRPFEALDIAGPLSDAGKAAMITNILAGRFHYNHAPFHSISKLGMTFLKSLLHHDYSSRIRSAEALENPWLQDQSKLLPSNTLVTQKSTRAVSQLVTAPESTELRRTGMVALVFGMQSYAATDLRTVFQSFDSDASGALSWKEFCGALKRIEPTMSDSDIARLFDIIDIDKNQQISYTEFLVATLDPREVDMEELSKAFRLLDEDGNGYISRDEMRTILKSQVTQALENVQSTDSQVSKNPNTNGNILNNNGLGILGLSALDRYGRHWTKEHLNEEVERRLQMIFSEVDLDCDGRISYDEFLWGMMNMCSPDAGVKEAVSVAGGPVTPTNKDEPSANDEVVTSCITTVEDTAESARLRLMNARNSIHGTLPGPVTIEPIVIEQPKRMSFKSFFSKNSLINGQSNKSSPSKTQAPVEVNQPNQAVLQRPSESASRKKTPTNCRVTPYNPPSQPPPSSPEDVFEAVDTSTALPVLVPLKSPPNGILCDKRSVDILPELVGDDRSPRQSAKTTTDCHASRISPPASPQTLTSSPPPPVATKASLGSDLSAHSGCGGLTGRSFRGCDHTRDSSPPRGNSGCSSAINLVLSTPSNGSVLGSGILAPNVRPLMLPSVAAFSDGRQYPHKTGTATSPGNPNISSTTTNTGSDISFRAELSLGARSFDEAERSLPSRKVRLPSLTNVSSFHPNSCASSSGDILGVSSTTTINSGGVTIPTAGINTMLAELIPETAPSTQIA